MIDCFLMVSTKKNQRNGAEPSKKASELTVSAGKKKPKCQPSADLEKIISLVNLVPPDFDWDRNLPPRDPFRREEPVEGIKHRLLEWLEILPAPLRTHLLEHMHRPEEWETWPQFSGDLRPVSLENLYNVVPHYQTIAAWQEGLQSIARRETSFRSDSVAYIDWDQGTIRYRKDRFEAALEDFDLRCIRECSRCGRIHLAKRFTYNGKEIEARCSEECAHRLRQARYEHNKETYKVNKKLKSYNKEQEQKKRASTSR